MTVSRHTAFHCRTDTGAPNRQCSKSVGLNLAMDLIQPKAAQEFFLNLLNLRLAHKVSGALLMHCSFSLSSEG